MRAHSSYFRRKNSKKGLALSTAMAICIVLSILVALLVSMATLNITTTQATVNQREAYIQAKSALSYAESYYLQDGERIPGAGNVGEGLIVFNTDNIADGAKFYETKTGTTTLIEDSTVEQYKADCVDTYITVKNSMTTTGESYLTLTAVSKYGRGDAYSLTKEFTVGGHSNIEDNAFTGTINYTGTNQTRYVRFHVRATTALGGAPYFYMWYNKVSPSSGSTYNEYALSSIENKLTFNKYYGTVQNGSWGSDGPEGACAMSYEGDGWYVTQKTFNLNRTVHFVNGIITKTGSSRSKGKDQQSWEFFGIPLPKEDELGANNGIDVYFELNRNQLLDMQWRDGQDEFTATYRDYKHNGDNGHTQLTDFVKFCSEYYTVYTKTDTAIMHYRKAGFTSKDDYNGDGVDYEGDGFRYEGYGWWRRTTHNFKDTSFGYVYGAGATISQNQYGKEKIIESFVVEDAHNNTAQFGYEEDANQWFIKHGDLSAGNYVEVNVKSAAQPVDPNDQPGARISYSGKTYESKETVPNIDNAVFDDALPKPEDTDLTVKEEPTVSEMANLGYGDLYLVGSMNDWGNNASWDSLNRKFESDSNGKTYSIEVDTVPGQEIQFWVVQKPDNIYQDWSDSWYDYEWHTLYDSYDKFTRITGEEDCYYRYYYYGRMKSEYVGSYTNWWGESGNVNSAFAYTPKSNKVKIIFAFNGNSVSYEEKGTTAVETDTDTSFSASKTYSVIGWMNEWGTVQDKEKSTDGTALYSLTRDMQMYSDVDGILTYSDVTLVVESLQDYKFKIAARDAGVDPNSPVDWTKVYNADGTPASEDPNVAAGDDDNAVLIKPKLGDDGKPAKYYVTITYGPNEETGDIRPGYFLTPFDDVDKYYVLSEFTGWESNEPVKSDYEITQAEPFEMTQVSNVNGTIEFEYTLNTIKEPAHYEFMVVGARSVVSAEDNHIDYTKAWGAGDENNVTEGGAQITMGSFPLEYDLTKRARLKVTFKYYKNDPTTSEIKITPLYVEEDSNVEMVYVGFHNAQLKNVNDSKKDSMFVNPWENVYVTYYTEKTGLNCYPARKADGGKNWWAQVPVDAEYVYFSNKRTNIYKELHSKSQFEYTVEIPNKEFVGAESTIFFPISSKTDDEERILWDKYGNSKDYFEYVNIKKDVYETDAQMAYYGSTQCNYYDAPFVNVLNMILTGDPKPSKKYVFSSVCWSEFEMRQTGGYGRGNVKLNFDPNHYVTYQGEKYYWQEITGWYIPNWDKSCSFMLINNPSVTRYNENGGNMYAYLFEDQLSLENNGWGGDALGTHVSSGYQALKNKNWYYTDDRNIGNYLYADDRAGGVFVSDTNYRDGTPSTFNYNGYTPSWFTYRIPVSNDITISDVSIVTNYDKSAGKPNYQSVVSGNTIPFTPVRETSNVNRPIYYYLSYDKDHNFETKTYTYNINHGVVDGTTDADGVTTVSVYFNNSDAETWSKVCVHATDPIGHEVYKPLDKDKTTPDNDYYVFPFTEGEYTFFQFYDGDDNKTGLENAAHKSSVLYLTGEELGTSSDWDNDNYSDLDSRTTKILCEGSATGFTWYMHPRTQIMRAYLDMDTVTQMTTDTKYFGYQKDQGVYLCYGEVKMSSFDERRKSLRKDYNDGNVPGASPKQWSAVNLKESGNGDGLLEAASEFMEAVSEARIYISENVKDTAAAGSRWDVSNNAWLGTDKDNMVFMEGEQIETSAFQYTSRWINGLKNVYKKIMLDSYHLTDIETGVQGSKQSNPNCVYTNEDRQSAAQFRQYTADLRLWLDNPQATIRPEAVRIIVDDSKKTVGKTTYGKWGKKDIHMYVKDPDPSIGWKDFPCEISETTQNNFYAFVFMLPASDRYYNAEFAIAKTMPVEQDVEGKGKQDVVDGVIVTKQRITPGKQYRFNTGYPLDDPKCFSVDTSTETKTYEGKDITKGENSPTSDLNQFIGMTFDKKFIINFKYDTKVTYDSESYMIYAGAYTIDQNYEGFYLGKKREDATISGIDLYTAEAKKFFTQQRSDGYMSYGMKSAKSYTDWVGSRMNSTKVLDIMTNNITKTGDIAASTSAAAKDIDNRINFRWSGDPSSDTMSVKQNITLKANTVTVAANVIDFKSANTADFYVDASTIIFMTDTTIKHADGSSAIISHGTYIINAKKTNSKSVKVSLKSTSDPETDWRSKFALVSDIGSELEGGRYVENN